MLLFSVAWCINTWSVSVLPGIIAFLTTVCPNAQRLHLMPRNELLTESIPDLRFSVSLLRLDIYLSLHHSYGLSSFQPHSNVKITNAGGSAPVD